MKQVTIKIDKKTGKITAETRGYGGESCKEATERLLDGTIDETTVQEELTDDYYNAEQQQLTQGDTPCGS